MRPSILLASLAYATTISAFPARHLRDSSNANTCIPYTTAIDIQQQWLSTLTAYNPIVAQNLLAPELVDYSASINYLIGTNLSSPTFPSAAAYMAGQGAQPPIGVEVLATEAVTCEGTIVLRWVATVGLGVMPAHGITILKAVQKGSVDGGVGPGGWQLGGIWTEFNSAAWVEDIGGNVTMAAPPSTTTTTTTMTAAAGRKF